ncbi:DUF1462 family protein [Thermosulfuriphilus sp.]
MSQVSVLVFDRPCLVAECTGAACMPGPAARCSMGKEVAEQFALLKEEVAKRFGNRAEVIYIDVNHDEQARRHEAAMAVLSRMLEPPVVVVDGQILASGEIPVGRIIQHLEDLVGVN